MDSSLYQRTSLHISRVPDFAHVFHSCRQQQKFESTPFYIRISSSVLFLLYAHEICRGSNPFWLAYLRDADVQRAASLCSDISKPQLYTYRHHWNQLPNVPCAMLQCKLRMVIVVDHFICVWIYGNPLIPTDNSIPISCNVYRSLPHGFFALSANVSAYFQRAWFRSCFNVSCA